MLSLLIISYPRICYPKHCTIAISYFPRIRNLKKYINLSRSNFSSIYAGSHSLAEGASFLKTNFRFCNCDLKKPGLFKDNLFSSRRRTCLNVELGKTTSMKKNKTNWKGSAYKTVPLSLSAFLFLLSAYTVRCRGSGVER